MNGVMADIMDGVDKKVGIVFTSSMHIKNRLARLKKVFTSDRGIIDKFL